jgi:hypothetical protein
MRLHMPSAGLGPIGPKPLRPYARADAYRLRALASLSMARSDRGKSDNPLIKLARPERFEIPTAWFVVLRCEYSTG